MSPVPTSVQRVVRVFISSTFRDMQAEREELMKQVFPDLRRICNDRHVELIEVDLRWGVTDEQKSEDRVVSICLEEIENCRPFFIGLIGQRYGWVPEALPESVLARESWIEPEAGQSITEIEILHGVLNNPDMTEHAFFFFRNAE